MKKFIKIPLVILGAIFGIFVIMLIIGAVLSSSDKSQKNDTTKISSSENTTELVLVEQKTSGINYSDYKNLLMAYVMIWLNY